MSVPRPAIAVLGCGAIGSHLAPLLDADLAVTFIDGEQVSPENLGIADFAEADLHQPKAAVLARRRRASGAIARHLHGEVRYVFRPGMVRALDAAVLCLDNPTAVHDAVEALWDGGDSELLVLALTCGGEDGGYLARAFVRPGACPICAFGDFEWRADHLGTGTSCVDTSAPRAAMAAAQATARLGADLLGRWCAGDRGIVRRRIQGNATYGPLVAHMPAEPSRRCPISHGRDAGAGEVQELGRITAVSIREVATRVATAAGEDAEILLGRRTMPLGGRYCPRCRAISAAPPLLAPHGLSLHRGCVCPEPLQPLAVRHSVGVRELLHPSVAPLTLAAWGAGHGDELSAIGSKGHIRLRCAFDWSDLDDR